MPKSPSRGRPKDDPRLTRVIEISQALPETIAEHHGSHAAFLVRKKHFAYYLDNHHGDGIVAITCKVAPGDNQLLAKAQPERFYLPAYVASKGWVALRLDRGEIDWDEVRELLFESYRRIAFEEHAQDGRGVTLAARSLAEVPFCLAARSRALCAPKKLAAGVGSS